MKNNRLLVFAGIALFYACSTKPTAKEIVDKAILAHGGETFNKVHAEFDFRDRHYTAIRNGGEFTYVRSFIDSTGAYLDTLNNRGFSRHRNDSLQTLTDERTNAFSNSVNSVIYFALLPFGLNDAAVIKQFVKEEEVKGKGYFVVKVSFQQEGGGQDFEDEFLYWISKEDFTVDYLAYSYHTNGGGIRFREAFNAQLVGGILWQDYINYKPENEIETKLEQLMSLFIKGELKELSRIELKNIAVK